MATQESDTEYNENFLKVGMIYSGLSREQVLAEAGKTRGRYRWTTLELGLESYLHELGVPFKGLYDGKVIRSFVPEILQWGRKLSELELKALRLKELIKEAGEEGIEIRIRGLE